MDATMKFVYPDMPEMDTIRSMTDVNLRHSNTKKYKKFKRQVKKIEKDWYGNSTYSLSVMTNKISKYHILPKSWCYYQSNLYDIWLIVRNITINCPFICQLPTMTSQTAYDDKNVNSRKHPGLSIVAIGNQQTMHASSRGGAQIRLNWQI